jgi:L-lactate dehydrogenase (cytochrome)
MRTNAAAAPIDPWKAFSGDSARGRLAEVLALDDFEALARASLPRPIFGYVAGAAETNASLADNRNAFAQWGFVPRVLRDVSARSQVIELFGSTYAAPFGVAPMGLAALTAFDGDRVLARAAMKSGIPFVLSATSLTRLEEVLEAAPGSWFQAYLPGEDSRIVALLDRVRAAGCGTLVVTVDLPVAGNRENNIRAGFSTPLRPNLRLVWDGLLRPGWLAGTLLRTLLVRGMPHFENSFAERGAPLLSSKAARDFSNRAQFSWRHIERIREIWKGKLVLKGILSLEDAALAKKTGADGVIVSNHGGRQLDGAVSALRVLAAIVREAGDMTVMMDGGVRRGSDVIKALALGARCVFIGRPFNYAASVWGEAGVLHAIDLLRSEIDRNLAMLGLDRISGIDRSILWQVAAEPNV